MECKDMSYLATSFDGSIGIYPEWNVKVIVDAINNIGSVNWNISRMECKDISIAYLSTSELYWNISRMECKVSFLTDCSISISLEYIQNGM